MRETDRDTVVQILEAGARDQLNPHLGRVESPYRVVIRSGDDEERDLVEIELLTTDRKRVYGSVFIDFNMVGDVEGISISSYDLELPDCIEDLPEVVSRAKAAEACFCSTRHLDRAIKAGHLSILRKGTRQFNITKDSIVRWVQRGMPTTRAQR